MHDVSPPADFRRLFETAAGLQIILKPDFTIAAVTDDYLRATMRRREEIVGRNLFDVFPVNPNDAAADGAHDIRASFERVLQTKQPDALPILRYDVHNAAESGEYEERYWLLKSFPLFDDVGEVQLIIHRVEDVTEQTRREQIQREQAAVEREKSTEALRESDERFHLVSQATNDAVWDWNLQTDALWWNEAVTTMFGYARETIDSTAAWWYEHIHPEDRERVVNGIHAVIDHGGENWSDEYRFRCADGDYKIIFDRGFAVHRVGKPVRMLGAMQDVTNAEQTREKLIERTKVATLYGDIGTSLNESEDLSEMLKHCTDALCRHLEVAFARIWTLDADGNVLELQASSGIYTHTDGAHSRVPVGKFKIGLIAEERQPHLTNDVQTDERVSDKDWARREKMVAFAGFPLILEDRLIGVMSVFAQKPLTSVTLEAMETVANSIAGAVERKQMEIERRRILRLEQAAQRELVNILERITEGFISIDRDWNFTYMNREGAAIAGRSPADVLGKNLWEIYPDAIGTAYEIEYNRAMREQIAVEFEEYLPSLDVWLGVSAYPSKTGLSVFFRDVTVRKRAEAEREKLLHSEQEARATAENANRLKDEFLATLSHELRTPLTSILGWSRMLNAGMLDAEKTARALETIERNAKAQSQLIEDVLDVSRIVSGKMRLDVRSVDLTAILETAIDAIRPAADAKSIEIRRVLDSKSSLISGDSDRLQQILWNLLSNAVKFTPKNGRVSIKLERINSHVEIVIADNGAGIEADTLPHVFERFSQADSSSTRTHGGLGLGLAIVRHLVELHGGTVRAASAGKNQGATFIVTFPIVATRSFENSADEAERINPTANQAVAFTAPPELKNLKILVVDDEPDSLLFLRFALEKCGSTVTTATSARDALAAINSDLPDVLVSDVGMPNEDGYDLIRQVRELAPERGGRIPAVALTAYARVEDRMRALRAGFQMHVPKPVEPAELAAIIASLAGWNKAS